MALESARLSRGLESAREREREREREWHSWQLQCEMPCVRPRGTTSSVGVECFKPSSGNTGHVYKLSPRPGGLEVGRRADDGKSV